jgi:hypothetical protein
MRPPHPPPVAGVELWLSTNSEGTEADNFRNRRNPRVRLVAQLFLNGK